MLGLGGPLQERGDVLGQLTLRRRRAVLVLNDLPTGGRASGGRNDKTLPHRGIEPKNSQNPGSLPQTQNTPAESEAVHL